jgi:hypothetical protein
MKNHVDPRIAPLDEREAILAEAKTAIEHKLAEVRKVGGAATRAEDELLREAIDYIDAGPPEMIRTAIAELLQPLMDERGMFRGLTETRRRLAELKRERAELLSAIEDDLLAVERAISGATSVTA